MLKILFFIKNKIFYALIVMWILQIICFNVTHLQEFVVSLDCMNPHHKLHL